MKKDNQSVGRKAQHTAKWARTMTKWLITVSYRKKANGFALDI
jgi:hypothetical protein